MMGKSVEENTALLQQAKVAFQQRHRDASQKEIARQNYAAIQKDEPLYTQAQHALALMTIIERGEAAFQNGELVDACTCYDQPHALMHDLKTKHFSKDSHLTYLYDEATIAYGAIVRIQQVLNSARPISWKINTLLEIHEASQESWWEENPIYIRATELLRELGYDLLKNMLGSLTYPALWAGIGGFIGVLALGLAPLAPLMLLPVLLGPVVGAFLGYYGFHKLLTMKGTTILHSANVLTVFVTLALVIAFFAFAVNPFTLMGLAAVGAGVGSAILVSLIFQALRQKFFTPPLPSHTAKAYVPCEIIKEGKGDTTPTVVPQPAPSSAPTPSVEKTESQELARLL